MPLKRYLLLDDEGRQATDPKAEKKRKTRKLNRNMPKMTELRKQLILDQYFSKKKLKGKAGYHIIEIKTDGVALVVTFRHDSLKGQPYRSHKTKSAPAEFP